MVKRKKIFGTTHRGKTPITSEKQIRYLHVHKIDHTHFKKGKKGKIIKVRHTYSKKR